MLKLMHIADVHLDSRFSGIPHSESVKKRAELRRVFSSALALAKKEGCKAVLIGGDLFDSEYYTEDTLAFLRDSFSSMPGCAFIIAPGNHDPYNSTSPYRFAELPSNVYVYKSESVTPLTVASLGLTVYGYAFTSQSHPTRPLDGFARNDNGNYSVLLAHTELDSPLSQYAPISRAELASVGFDYAALGHIHNGGDIASAGDTIYAYSGCLAGRDFGECGEKGGIIVTLDTLNGKHTVSAEKVRICPWSYEIASVPLDSAPDEDSALKLITEAISSDKGIDRVIRLCLTGQVCYELDPAVMLRSLSKLGVKEIKDETVFAYSTLALDDDFSLRGEFYRVLKPKLTSDDPAERERAVKALKYGLSALGGCDIGF